MKTVPYLFVLGLLIGPSLKAAVLVSDPGPWTGSSFSSNWIALKGWSINPQPSSLNTVQYDAVYVSQGSPLGGPSYTMKITVWDLHVGAQHSTRTVPIGTGSNVTISVPSGRPYNVTFWIMSSQLSGPDYWKVKLSNVVIQN